MEKEETQTSSILGCQYWLITDLNKRMQIIRVLWALLMLPWKHPRHLIPIGCQGRVPDARTSSLTSHLNVWGSNELSSMNRKK